MDSEVLDNIHEQFIDMIFKYGIRIHFFQEGREISGIKELNGKIRCSSLEYAISDYTNLYRKTQIISDFSSKLGLPTIERVESIDANHI